MKLTLQTIGWAVLSGIGIAGILNTVMIIASGLGRFSLGNTLPAILGAVLMGIGIKKLLGPEIPLFSNPIILHIFQGILGIAGIWVAVLLLLICFCWPSARADFPEWMLVLGAGLRGDQLSLTLRERLDTAAAYWRLHPEMKIIVSGGQGPHELISEAEAMYRYMEQVGIPRSQLYQEDKSTSTWENVEFSKVIMNKAGRDSLKPLVIVSNRYHLFRAIEIAKSQGIEAVGVPAATPGSVFIGSYMREILAVTKFLMRRQ